MSDRKGYPLCVVAGFGRIWTFESSQTPAKKYLIFLTSDNNSNVSREGGMPGSGGPAPDPGGGNESEVSVTPRSSEDEKPGWKEIKSRCVFFSTHHSK